MNQLPTCAAVHLPTTTYCYSGRALAPLQGTAAALLAAAADVAAAAAAAAAPAMAAAPRQRMAVAMWVAPMMSCRWATKLWRSQASTDRDMRKMMAANPDPKALPRA